MAFTNVILFSLVQSSEWYFGGKQSMATAGQLVPAAKFMPSFGLPPIGFC
jgi:hypothetical protein